MKSTNDFNLSDLMPDSIRHDSNVKTAAEAIDPQLREIATQTDIPAIYANIDKLSSNALDHLAVQWDVAAWRDNWSLQIKRNVLRQSIQDKRKTGTLGAVKRILASVGTNITVEEWFQKTPKGIPHTFSIVATLSAMGGTEITEEFQEDIRLMIDATKPLRSHYDFLLQQSLNGGLGMFGFLRVLTTTKITPGVSQYNPDTIVQGEVNVVAANRAIIQRQIVGQVKEG